MNLRIVRSKRDYALAALLLVFAILLGAASDGQASEGAAFDFTELIKDTIIYGNITKDTPAYNDYSNSRRQTGEFKSGEVVEVLRDRAYAWYLVKAEDGREGWIAADSISIPGDPETNLEQLPQAVLEAYVTTRGLSSKTDHLVWVDLDRQLTHVFTGKQGAWSLVRTMPSSTGKNVSPTLRGLHEIAERGTWFYSPFLGRGGEYWVQFSGPYMFHSLPMDQERNIVDYTLLERRSAGCIRLSMQDSEWFYSFIKRGSTVFVN
jgi:hypothetical protein